MDDEFAALVSLARQRQIDRGLTEFFRIGDIVRFAKGVPHNRERNYTIVAIYFDGFEVAFDGYIHPYTDDEVIRLGMTKE